MTEFIESLRLQKPYQRFLVLAACSGLALGGYLSASQFILRPGFPLDDAWIHQTYARNLAYLGEWAFLPGVPSAGSTAPLWSLLLTIGYLLKVSPLAWAFGLGGCALAGIAWVGDRLGKNLFPIQQYSIPWVGLFLAGEWHLVWASGSGMETLLFSWMILVVFLWISQERWSPGIAGLFCGFCLWIRPDGLTLLGPVSFLILFQSTSWAMRSKKILLLGAGVLLAAAPYFLFNLILSGHAWPNTLYAKQAEYAIRQQTPYVLRLAQLISLPWIGAGITLVPGFFYSIWRGWRRRQWLLLSACVWWLGYTGIYAAVLPVDYQHGRYLIPAMPVYFIIGLTGSISWIQEIANIKWCNLVRTAWAMIVGITWMLFYLQGAFGYAKDVAIIETEMVDTSQWISKNIRPGALLAAHDIGALGYFGNHRILDLAGLITPDVIPFIRDEDRLADFIQQNKVEYFVTFPGWYPNLVKSASLIYQSPGHFSPQEGGENMGVYRWVGNGK